MACDPQQPKRSFQDTIYGPPMGGYHDRDMILSKMPKIYGDPTRLSTSAYQNAGEVRSYMSHLNRGVEYVSKGIEQLKSISIR